MTHNEGRVRHLFRHTVEHQQLSEREVREMLSGVPAPMLLLSLLHVTGDIGLLDKNETRVGQFEAPALMIKEEEEQGDPAKLAVAEEGVQEELIELLVDELTQTEHEPYASFVDDPETFQRMSRIAAGPVYNPDHLGLNQEQCGFAPDELTLPVEGSSPEWLNLVIVGAGMGGLDAAVKAADRGISYQVLEKESGIGGLWWTQRYPGVAVDTPTSMYSLSWHITPEWTRYYPSGAEYCEYLNDIADTYGIREHVQCNSEVIRMEWLEDDQVWELTVLSTTDHSSRTLRAATVLTAAGNLCRPLYPRIEGIDSFEGDSVHTGRWRDVELEGRRVAVVGVGAAGVQIVSDLAPRVDSLTVFQRQAHWVLPNNVGDGDVSDTERWLRRHLPYYTNWQRLGGNVRLNLVTFDMNQWDEDWVAQHENSCNAVNADMRAWSLRYIHDCFGEGSKLAEKLTPDFPFGAKRPVRDPDDFVPGGYYWAFAQPHVELVTSPIARVVPEGIVTADGDVIELDVIVWATGMTLDNLVTVDVIGRAGVELREVWADDGAWQGPRAFLGGAVPGFPNLFITDGPNTGVALGGGSHNFMAETMNHYILECVQLLAHKNARSLEVTSEAFDRYQADVDRLQAGLMWANEHRAHTYYRNSAGRAFFASPFEVSDFWRMNRRPDPEAFTFTADDKLIRR